MSACMFWGGEGWGGFVARRLRAQASRALQRWAGGRDRLGWGLCCLLCEAEGTFFVLFFVVSFFLVGFFGKEPCLFCGFFVGRLGCFNTSLFLAGWEGGKAGRWRGSQSPKRWEGGCFTSIFPGAFFFLLIFQSGKACPTKNTRFICYHLKGFSVGEPARRLFGVLSGFIGSSPTDFSKCGKNAKTRSTFGGFTVL